jgi:hypothetical protein
VTVATRFLVPLAVLASSAVTLPAAAQSAGGGAASASAGATDNRAVAEMLFFTARGLMEAGRISEACAKLTESYRLDPAAGTLLNLGVCHQKEGKIASAWGEFRQSIADARKANRPDREKLATDALALIEPELPFLAITVPPEVRQVPGLVISRNGVPLNAAAWSTELPVDPGTVEIEETAPDYKPKTLKLTIANKEHQSIAAEPLELAPIVRPPPPFWTTKRTVGVALFGVGVVAAGVGAYFGVTALNDVNNSTQQCPADRVGVSHCTQAGVSSMNDANTAAWISDFTIGAAAVSALVGTYLFLSGGAREQPAGAATPPTASAGPWSWSVSAGPHSAGGLLTKSF